MIVDDRLQTLQTEVPCLCDASTQLEKRVEDAKGRSLRNNVWFIGVPEGLEGSLS